MVNVQVTTLSNVEAKKRFEFLEAVSGTMDAHLRYFKQVGNFSVYPSIGFGIFLLSILFIFILVGI